MPGVGSSMAGAELLQSLPQLEAMCHSLYTTQASIGLRKLDHGCPGLPVRPASACRCHRSVLQQSSSFGCLGSPRTT